MKASKDMVSILTTIFELVDDWYQSLGQKLLKGKVGAKPEFSERDVGARNHPYLGETQ